MRYRQRTVAALIGWTAVLACSEPQSRPSDDLNVAECAIPSADSSVWELPVLPGTQILNGNGPPEGLDSAYAYFMRNLAATENDGRPPATLTVVDFEHDGPVVVACQPADGTRPKKTWRLLVKKVFSNIPTVAGVTRSGTDSVEGATAMDSVEEPAPVVASRRGKAASADEYGRSLVREAGRSWRRTRTVLIANLRDSNPLVRASALDILRQLGLGYGWKANVATPADALLKEWGLAARYDTVRTDFLEPLAREIASGDTARAAAMLRVFQVLCPADVWLEVLERTPTYSREPGSLRPAEELLRRRVETGDPQCSPTSPDDSR